HRRSSALEILVAADALVCLLALVCPSVHPAGLAGSLAPKKMGCTFGKRKAVHLAGTMFIPARRFRVVWAWPDFFTKHDRADRC
ncbi:MAG: hypothetical protein D3923_13120, partial [Candidatus Electrothrix sp. AR3]|nr:hypothetical protein [Candidatus Electrothrix sp. AR3]